MSAPRALLLYTDDSVEVQYRDGARLFVSPCGTEFMYERPQAGCHPVQRGRHRTEFVTSSCREQVLQALSFRNTFSSCPFLPSSLIPSEEIMTLLAEICEVTWPAVEDDTGCVTHLEDGSVKVSSLDGHADLYMTALQKEFTVKFLCQLSCTPCDAETAIHDKVNADPKTAGIKTRRDVNRSKYSSCVLREEPPSCLTKHASRYTWLVQRFSVADCPPSFQYPVDLALLFHRKLAQPGDTKQFVDTDKTTSGAPDRRTVSALPRTLPLTCPAAHMHRLGYWKASLEGDTLAVNPLPLKVVIYDGALYRFILDGTNMVEIHPGDGSVFISEGDCMGKYFKHFFIQADAKQVEDRLYTARDLPPDKPRALYSVRAVISQARRFLDFCCQHKLSLDPLSHTCCWRMGSGPDSRAVNPLLLEQSFIPNQGRFAAYSNNTVCASYLDGVLLYMIWNFANFNKNEECPDSTVRHERFSWCCLRFPDGSSKLVELEDPGEYASYIGSAVTWCRWLDEKSLGERPTPSNTETDLVKGFGVGYQYLMDGRLTPHPSTDQRFEYLHPYNGRSFSETARVTVAHELEKIQRFNFLLENNSRKALTTDIPSQPSNADNVQDEISEMDIQSILEKTSKAIQDIDLLLSSRKS